MPKLPERKVGIVACSGEELAEGTVTRLAALKVLHELRRGQTETICLPLFLAGGKGDRAFARVHPTITVDGCELRCAARGTEMYSGKPAVSIVVSELVAQAGLAAPERRRHLNDRGAQAVEVTTGRLVQLVDQVLQAKGGGTGTTADAAAPLADNAPAGTCSCGSAIPVTTLAIDGKRVEMVALPLIFEEFHESGRRAGDPAVAGALFQTAKVYNEVPREAEASCREAILHEYAAFCERKGAR